jgi:hypothetical protein
MQLLLPYRHNFKWNVNELLSLQREYELLEWSIQEIADKHERTVHAILYRLQYEGFIETWLDATGYQEYSKDLSCVDDNLDSNVNPYDYEEDIVEDEDVKDEDYIVDDEDYEEEDDEDEDEDEDDISNLNQRVWGVLTAVSDIKGMIGTLLSKFSSSTSAKPLKKLRQTHTQVSYEI